MEKQIKIGVDSAEHTLKSFIDTWKRIENGEKVKAEQRLYFENFETLFKTLTPERWFLLKKLRANGPMNIHTLARTLDGNYAKIDTNVKLLEHIGLINRTQDDKISVPWDIVETRLRLAA